jgi:exonuclease VII large subunit
LVLQRGYAWLVDGAGHTLTSPDQTRPGQSVHATLAGGVLDLMVPQRD